MLEAVGSARKVEGQEDELVALGFLGGRPGSREPAGEDPGRAERSDRWEAKLAAGHAG